MTVLYFWKRRVGTGCFFLFLSLTSIEKDVRLCVIAVLMSVLVIKRLDRFNHYFVDKLIGKNLVRVFYWEESHENGFKLRPLNF